MNALGAALEKELSQAGYRYRLAGVEIIDNLRDTMAMLLERGLLSTELSAEYAGSIRFEPPPELPEVRSLVVVAAPSPPVTVLFHLDGRPVEAVIPPTYISSAIRAHCLEVLSRILSPAGYVVARVPVPVKLLAVRAGLAEYGRNNIAYVIGSGSLFRLDTFATDADLFPPGEQRGGLSRFIVGGRDPESGHWSLPRRMGSCSACKACFHACPTGCIPHPLEGVVIEATRCLTYLNEHPGRWPYWLDSDSHNCLVGCMVCQRVCPANKYRFRRESRVAEFDRSETDLILENLPADELPTELRTKLARLDLDEYSTVLGRNLLALRGSLAGDDRHSF